MSIWNGKLYFGWPEPPWGGVVYEVGLEAIGLGKIILLPDGHELQILQVGISQSSSRNRSGAPIYSAIKVFDTNAEAPTFQGDWEKLLWQLNAAGAVNALFTVYLPKEEYERLSADGRKEFEVLKRQMSPRVASLVDLLENDYVHDDEDPHPCLFLYRTGSCP